MRTKIDTFSPDPEKISSRYIKPWSEYLTFYPSPHKGLVNDLFVHFRSNFGWGQEYRPEFPDCRDFDHHPNNLTLQNLDTKLSDESGFWVSSFQMFTVLSNFTLFSVHPEFRVVFIKLTSLDSTNNFWLAMDSFNIYKQIREVLVRAPVLERQKDSLPWHRAAMARKMEHIMGCSNSMETG